MAIRVRRDKRFRLTGDKLRAINQATRDEVGRRGVLLSEPTVATWDTQVGFTAVDKRTAVEIVSDSKIFNWVNRGTRPHEIRPRGPWPLRFPGGFTAKTTPGSLSSGPGGSFGDTIVARSVQHPGIKARRFDKLIAEKLKPFVLQIWREQRAKILGR